MFPLCGRGGTRALSSSTRPVSSVKIIHTAASFFFRCCLQHWKYWTSQPTTMPLRRSSERFNSRAEKKSFFTALTSRHATPDGPTVIPQTLFRIHHFYSYCEVNCFINHLYLQRYVSLHETTNILLLVRSMRPTHTFRMENILFPFLNKLFRLINLPH